MPDGKHLVSVRALTSKDAVPLVFFFYIYINVFIYFSLRWVFVAARGLSLVGGERRLLFVVVRGLLIAVASLVAEPGF